MFNNNSFTIQIGYYGGTSTKDYAFGADFYTEQYTATKHASDNIIELGEYMSDAMKSQMEVFGGFAMAFGIIVALIGGVITCYFGCKMYGTESKSLPINTNSENYHSSINNSFLGSNIGARPLAGGTSSTSKSEEKEWKCSKCGTINPSYVGTCSCGNGKS